MQGEESHEDKELKPLAAFAHLAPFDFPRDHNPALIYLTSLAAGKSRETVGGILGGLARLASGGRIPFERFPWHQLTYVQMQALRTEIGERWAPAGGNLRLSVLRRVLEEAFAVGLMSGDDYLRSRRVRNFRGSSKPRGRALTQEEVRITVQECRSRGGPKGLRDAAMFVVLYATGARRQELVRIAWPDDVDLERGVVALRTKGANHRTADLQRPVVQAIEDWLNQRGRAPGPLFCRVDRHGNLFMDNNLTPSAVLKLCVTLARDAGVRHFSPHDMRRTFASELLDSGVDLHVVQEMLDHQEIATTARYDPGRSKRRRSAAELLRMPF